MRSIAFALKFPTLDGIPVSTLLKIRQNERDHFCRFQSRLKRVVSETLSGHSVASVDQFAEEIRQDVIEPELRKIKSRLNASKRVLGKNQPLELHSDL